MERHYDNNPWADKLSQVSIPDIGEAWKGMEMLLDKEMPVGRKRDKRRWFLLILLLLLLIGVCNCPGRGWISGDRFRHGSKDSISQAGKEHPVEPVVQGGRDKPEQGQGGRDKPEQVEGGREIQEHVGGGRERPEHAGGGRDTLEQMEGSKDKPKQVQGGRHISERAGGDTLAYADRGVRGHGGRGIRRDQAVVTGKRRHTHPLKPGEGDRKTGNSFGDTVEKQEQTDTTGGEGQTGKTELPDKDGHAGKTGPPGKDSTLLPKAIVKKDSVHKASGKPAPKPPEENKHEKGWWTVGIGLNQFFTVGGQQASHYNSGGISGALGDYIPVPAVRYHFNRKFFLQLEAQLNSPQYTRKDLVLSKPPVDSISPTQGRQSSVLIKKLFYFNVPLSIHYNVFRTLDVGAGLQFSRLSNGVGVFQNQLINTVVGSIDSSSSVSKSFKGDTLYKKIKTNEFRILLDASYTWKSFIFGVRYNQSLSKFINIQVSPGQITQARNSSLQLYLRYILWDNQKKHPLMTK